MTRQMLGPGMLVGRYQVRTLLGAGAMADVYLAFDPRQKRDVALKVLAPGPGASDRLRRFEREARSAAAMAHPNIVTVFEVGWQDRTPFIVMEYVSGRTLRDRLDEGPLPLEDVLEVGAQLADGLGAAHEAGIVHRDLKPANVMITAEGVAKILDFGLSKPIASPNLPSDAVATDEVLTLPGTILGTLQYMSPEQASGYRVDYRSDQFSLGSIMYEMATGVPPFARDTVPRTLAAIIEGKPEGREVLESRAPAEVLAVLDRILAKHPEERYPSMEELAAAIRSARKRSAPGRVGWRSWLASLVSKRSA